MEDESPKSRYLATMQFGSRSLAFDHFWRFASKRHDAYLARAGGRTGPWTDDPIIERYRFTNVFRAADRVSQFLIGHVQYSRLNDMSDEDIVFRTMLFKLFNNILTWRSLENRLGPIRWAGFNFEEADRLLESIISSGTPIYSAAYIMPSPPFGAKRKHTNHLRLLKLIMDEGLTKKVSLGESLESIYRALLAYPGLGSFLAFQFAIDLNYSILTDFDEDDFVVAGPGAQDGIRKCFPKAALNDAERIIFWMVENQEEQFRCRGINFRGLFGRPLKAIDCQNIFCEISKYGRVAFPEIAGVSNRTRIKQAFRTHGRAPLEKPFFPPKWKLRVDLDPEPTHAPAEQLSFESYS